MVLPVDLSKSATKEKTAWAISSGVMI